MANNGYNYDFRMFLEGLPVKFKSFNIICTPNGVEASINLHPNEELLELKPKTAVQIFHREWVNPEGGEKKTWQLCFDGFFSRFDKTEQVEGGRGVAILCRDMRMDIRKMPAYMSYDGKSLEDRQEYYTTGLYKNIVYGGYKSGDIVRHYDDGDGLSCPAHLIKSVAATATGGDATVDEKGKLQIKDGKPVYNIFNGVYPTTKADGEKYKVGNGNFLLDAFVKGLWIEAVGGTVAARFLNKRIRADKRFLVPQNEAGFSMFSDQHLGKIYGQAIMGNAKFTSIEAAIMRIAGLFMCRVFSCNTPSIIDIRKDIDGQENKAVKYIMSDDVRSFLTSEDIKDEFGKPYILTSSLLLPPLEFTAPPTFNLIFPCMYDRASWQYDQDVDVTRGYFKQISWMSTPESTEEILSKSINIPNSLFYFSKESEEGKPEKRDVANMTIEERYKGINIMQGTVSRQFAYNDLTKSITASVLKAKAHKRVKAAVKKYESEIDDATSREITKSTVDEMLKAKSISSSEADALKADIKRLEGESQATEAEREKVMDDTSIDQVMRRHAIFKFLNTKFAGRTIVVDGAYNPYVMCGFPGAVLADDNANSYKTQKTVIGMVQQVKHLVTIEGEASTTVVMNNARFIDEPTDIDDNGSPMYMKATDKTKAAVNKDTLEHTGKGGDEAYFAEDGKPKVEQTSVKSDDNNVFFKLKKTEDSDDYIYAKDVLVVTPSKTDDKQTNVRIIDSIYEPNKISKFYRDVFGQRNHYMIGSDGDDKFAYDSIHEALNNLMTNKKALLGDYAQATNYIKRNICSEEEFYCLILGSSVREVNPNATGEDDAYIYYVKDRKDLKPEKHQQDGYFGISNEEYEKRLKNKGWKAYTTIEKPGDFSSITEGVPTTTFISERREAVLKYKQATEKQAHGVAF